MELKVERKYKDRKGVTTTIIVRADDLTLHGLEALRDHLEDCGLVQPIPPWQRCKRFVRNTFHPRPNFGPELVQKPVQQPAPEQPSIIIGQLMKDSGY